MLPLHWVRAFCFKSEPVVNSMDLHSTRGTTNLGHLKDLKFGIVGYLWNLKGLLLAILVVRLSNFRPTRSYSHVQSLTVSWPWDWVIHTWSWLIYAALGGDELIPAWIDYNTNRKEWDEITYPFPVRAAVEVWEWISTKFIPLLLTGRVINFNYPCWYPC